MALVYAKQKIELREITLKNKPISMLGYSPKGTVPVLVLVSGKNRIIDESLEIMHWALSQNDPEHWLPKLSTPEQSSTGLPLIAKMEALIHQCDHDFKPLLDRYKYANRHPEHTEIYYRTQGEAFIQALEKRLTQQTFILGEQITLADIAIFPFIRQFAHVDLSWFEQSPYPNTQRWLKYFKSSELFMRIMQKHPPWEEDEQISFL
jgi:glutathione S-transferase